MARWPVYQGQDETLQPVVESRLTGFLGVDLTIERVLHSRAKFTVPGLDFIDSLSQVLNQWLVDIFSRPIWVRDLSGTRDDPSGMSLKE